MKFSKDGFTLVELIIVVVVIAILTAVSVVAYSGIQQRSELTRTTVAVTEYTKGLQRYAAENGGLANLFNYPGNTSGGWVCLGVRENYPANPATSNQAGQCGHANGSVETMISSNVDVTKKFISYLGGRDFMFTPAQHGYQDLRGVMVRQNGNSVDIMYTIKSPVCQNGFRQLYWNPVNLCMATVNESGTITSIE